MVSTAPVQRFSWFLPYLQTRPHPRPRPSSSSFPAAAMDPEQATFWLSQLIGKTLRIHASDGRVFIGTFKCTDKDRNVILALAYEYRAPPAAAVRQAVEDAGEATAVPWDSRYVGLVVVPGQHVRKIELEESLHPGMKSGVLL